MTATPQNVESNSATPVTLERTTTDWTWNTGSIFAVLLLVLMVMGTCYCVYNLYQISKRNKELMAEEPV